MSRGPNQASGTATRFSDEARRPICIRRCVGTPLANLHGTATGASDPCRLCTIPGSAKLRSTKVVGDGEAAPGGFTLIATADRCNYLDGARFGGLLAGRIEGLADHEAGRTRVIVAFLPQSLLLRLPTDRATAWHVNVVFSHAILLSSCAFSWAVVPMIGRWPHACLGRTWMGMACPGCGIITSLDCLARGNIDGSLAANPAGSVLAVGLVLHLLLHAFAIGRRQHRPICNRISQRISVSFWTFLLIVWLHRLVSQHL